MTTLIRDAQIVNEGTVFRGSLVIAEGMIAEIYRGDAPQGGIYNKVIDAKGMFLLPGVIDDHVHFRDPGLTHKADIASESRAAAAGGVTTYFDMPNTVPQTTTLEALAAKFDAAARDSRVNYSFFFGATNTNGALLGQLNKEQVCGVKLFMGSSTGNMLVDKAEALEALFRTSPLLIMAHCEDTERINANAAHYKTTVGDDPAVTYHPLIRDTEACYRSTALAVKLAQQTGVRLHIAHISTARELELFESLPLDEKRITAEACVAHLMFCDEDYATLGTRIKCNPAIKTTADRDALRAALRDGRIDVVGTDHAPHLLEEKVGGALRAVSGMPMVQFSLAAMLSLVDEGVITLPQLVEKMSHAPARLFDIDRRGYLRKGYYADIVLVKPDAPWKVSREVILSKCGWSPLEGRTFNWKVERTIVNGQTVYDNGTIDDTYRGQSVRFKR